MTMLSTVKKAVHQLRDKLVVRRAQKTFEERSGQLLILNYHRVLRRDFAELDTVEPGMFVFEDTFRKHLVEALCHFDVVDLGKWVAGSATAGDRPAFAVTFDDGWKDNHDVALPVLRDLGIPATVFVVSEFAGTDRSFWPERLARRLKHLEAVHLGENAWLKSLVQQAGLPSGAPTPEQISRVIALAKKRPDEAIVAELDSIDSIAGPPQAAGDRDLASWEELKGMVESGFVSLGSHTRGHVRMLPKLATRDVEYQIAGSREDIEQRAGHRPTLFCFPNGDVSPEALRVVKRNYEGACTTDRGWNAPGADPYALRRVSLHEDRSSSREAFLARIAEAS